MRVKYRKKLHTIGLDECSNIYTIFTSFIDEEKEKKDRMLQKRRKKICHTNFFFMFVSFRRK